jgi:hypothetical protein
LKYHPHRGLSMLRKMLLGLAILAGLLSPVHGAGTVPGFSLTTQFDQFGKVTPGCHLFVIQAGTVSTPQIAYQDVALTIPAAGGSQLTCDAFGRLPQFFLADGSIKLRLTDRNGVQIFTQDGLLVVGASSGGGGGSPVDPTTILQTGFVQPMYGTGILTGFVRANGRTIGSATSGATERANADTQALFQFLWNADPNLPVSTGRGASANADWVANKQLQLPDYRGRAIAGLADMGNTATAALTATYFLNSVTTLGAAGGNQANTLVMTNLPASPAPLSVIYQATVNGGANNAVAVAFGAAQTNIQQGTGSAVGVFAIDKFTSIDPKTLTANTANLGAGTAFPVVPPMMLITIYLKL